MSTAKTILPDNSSMVKKYINLKKFSRITLNLVYAWVVSFIVFIVAGIAFNNSLSPYIGVVTICLSFGIIATGLIDIAMGIALVTSLTINQVSYNTLRTHIKTSNPATIRRYEATGTSRLSELKIWVILTLFMIISGFAYTLVIVYTHLT
jgi:hypothetical protein